MGLFDSWFQPSDSSVGQQVLEAYYYEASKFNDFNFQSYDDWVNFLNSKVPEFPAMIGELVNMNVASTTVDGAVERAAQLANETSGQASVSQITQAAGGKGDTVNYMAAIPDVGLASGAQLVDTFQNVGSGVLSTANMMKYLPWILGAAGAIYLYSMGSATGGSIGSLLKVNPRKRRR